MAEGAGADGSEAVLLGEVFYADDGFQGFRLQVSGCRFQVAGCRLQVLDPKERHIVGIPSYWLCYWSGGWRMEF